MIGSIKVGQYHFIIKDCGHLVSSSVNNLTIQICDACFEIKRLKEVVQDLKEKSE